MDYMFIAKDNYPKQYLLYLYFERIFELGELIGNSASLEERIKYIEQLDREITGSNIYWWNNYMKLVLDPNIIDLILFYKYQNKDGHLVKVPIIHRNKLLQNLDLSKVDWTGINFDIDSEEVPREIKKINNARKSLATKSNRSDYYFDYTDTNIKLMDFSKIKYLKNVKLDGIDLSKTNIETIQGLFECSLENCNLPPEKVIKLIELIVKEYEMERTTKFRYTVEQTILKNNLRKNQVPKSEISCSLILMSKAVEIDRDSSLEVLASLVNEQTSFSITESERQKIIKELTYYNQDWEEYNIWGYFFEDDFKQRFEQFPIIFGEMYEYMEDENMQRRHAANRMTHILKMIKNGLFNGTRIYCQESNKSIIISNDTTPKEFIEAIFPELSKGKFLDYYNYNFNGKKIMESYSPKDQDKNIDDDRKYNEIIMEYKEKMKQLEETSLYPFINPLILSGQIPNVVEYVKMTKQEKTIFKEWIIYCKNNYDYCSFIEYKEQIKNNPQKNITSIDNSIKNQTRR